MKQNNKYNDESVRDLLGQMPNVEDRQSADELYKKVSKAQFQEELDRSKRRKHATAWIAGLASVSIVVLIIMVIVPSMKNSVSYDMANEESSSSEEQNRDKSTAEHEAKLEQDESSKESASFDALEEKNNSFMSEQATLSSHVIRSSEGMRTAVAAVSDPSGQYIVPFSFGVPEDQYSYEELYEAMATSIDSGKWNTQPYPFSAVTFDVNEKEKTVEASFPSDYEFPSSSTQVYLFKESLKAMFNPLSIKTITLKTEDQEGVQLGNYDTLTNIQVDGKRLYRLYKPQTGPELLIAKTLPNDSTVEDALQRLGVDDPDVNVYRTIPDRIKVQIIEKKENHLNVRVTSSEILGNNQETLTMIESILLTVKQYDYEEVTFHQFPVDQVGGYDLTRPIPVPLAANPMPLEIEQPN